MNRVSVSAGLRALSVICVFGFTACGDDDDSTGETAGNTTGSTETGSATETTGGTTGDTTDETTGTTDDTADSGASDTSDTEETTDSGDTADTGDTGDTGNASVLNDAVYDENNCPVAPVAPGFDNDVVCPGCSGCESGTGTLKVGVAKRAISVETEPWDDKNSDNRWQPNEPFTDTNKNGKWDGVWISNANNKLSLAKNDDIWSRVTLIERGDVRIAIVSMDLFGYFRNEVNQIREAAEEAGLDIDHIVVNASHNHSAPDTIGMYGEKFGVSGYYPEWMKFIRDQTVEALKDAVANLKPAKAVFAVSPGTSQELIRDSRDPQAFEKDIRAFKFINAEDDSVLGVLTIWGNHMESMGIDQTVLTADFAWGYYETIEKMYPGAQGQFWQGMVGGLMTVLNMPVKDKDDNVLEDESFPRAFRVGELLAEAVNEALEGPDTISLDDAQISFKKKVFFAPVDNPTFRLLFSLAVFNRGAYKASGQQLTVEEASNLVLSKDKAYLDSETNEINIGPIQIVTIGGEIYPEWVMTKEDDSYYYFPRYPEADFPDAEILPPLWTLMRPDAQKIVTNLTNDFTGYMVPKHQWDLQKPCILDDCRYGETNSLGPETVPTVHKAVATMLARPFPKSK